MHSVWKETTTVLVYQAKGAWTSSYKGGQEMSLQRPITCAASVSEDKDPGSGDSAR